MRYINIKSYEFAVRSINEIGKMVGGWIKQVVGVIEPCAGEIKKRSLARNKGMVFVRWRL